MSTQAEYKAGRYAAIDVGTVTARVLVADVDARGRIHEVHRDQEVCNLGVGVDKTGVLDPAAIDRVGRVVARFVGAMNDLRASDGLPITVVANATSASRDAANAADFVNVLADLGVELSVIPGEREAALSFAGASSAFPGEKVVVLDVGGGSSEIIAGVAGLAPEKARSFNIGCRRVTERYFHDDPIAPASLDEAASWIRDTMSEYLGDLAGAGFGSCRVVAVAGTATSIVSMRERMQVYDSQRVHGAVVDAGEVSELLGQLSRLTLEERRQVVGLHPDRAPVIVAGVLIIREILALLGAGSFTASERDILHGIILDAALRPL